LLVASLRGPGDLHPASDLVRDVRRGPSQATALVVLKSMRERLETAEGFGDVYREHARAILVFLTRRTFDPEVALDLTAETFAQAFAKRRRFRGQTEDELRAWLHAIASGVLGRYVRRGIAERRALSRLGVAVPEMEPDEVLRVIELAGLEHVRSSVAERVRSLPPAQREALQLRVVEQLPYPDVAARLQVSEPAARARVSRALRVLAPHLKEVTS
jgi:RNA polymerase sigma factor (sigma-70 family)